MRELGQLIRLADRQSKIEHLRKRPENQDYESQLYLSKIERARFRTVDKIVPWLFREMKKGRIDMDALFIRPDHFDHIEDWLEAKHPNLMSMKYEPDVIEAVYEWDKELRQKMEDEAEYEDHSVVHDFGDGWTVQSVTTSADLKTEGELMGHCVGGYCDDVHSGGSYIYSIRDPQNRPHVTIETDRPVTQDNYAVVRQIQGKQNDEPIREYRERVQAWLSEYPVRYQKTRNLFPAEIVDGVTPSRDEYGVLEYLPPSWAHVFKTFCDWEDRGLMSGVDPNLVANTLVVIALESGEEDDLANEARACQGHPLGQAMQIAEEVLSLLEKFSRPSA